MQVQPILPQSQKFPVNCLPIRGFVKSGNPLGVESILKDKFIINLNVSLCKNMPYTILTYTLGRASLPDTELKLQKAKKIVQILQSYGAPKQEFSHEEAKEFMKEMDYLSPDGKTYAEKHQIIIEKMKELQETIHKVLSVALNVAPTFILCHSAESSSLSILPKEITNFIALTLHKVVQQSFD